jgi:hypothetical protein
MWEIDGIIIKEKQLSVIWQWCGIQAAVRWGVISVNPSGDFTEQTQRHELVHQAQQKAQSKYIIFGYPKFVFKYLWWYLQRGYENNPFELEARAGENRVRFWESVSKDSWKGYI